ncbi:ribonuclease HII [archaeon]|nr:ribonuclease HII [archaeon]
MKILGIDEAGRGALVGPLVIGGFMIDDLELGELKRVGVKDSKLLTPEKRAELYKWLKSNGDYKTIKVSPGEIDMKNSVGVNLNMLEINKMTRIIQELKPDTVIIDSPSHNESRVKKLFQARVNCEVVCECKADYKYPVVGAGSILAKHERDTEIKLLEKELGVIIGAGYPSDERTIKFAKQALNKNAWQEHLRKSWSTYSLLKKEQEQRTLTDY